MNRNIFCSSVSAFCLFASSALAQRAITTGNIAFYIAPPSNCATGYWGSGGTVTACGSDVTGNGTQGAPWATCQHAITVLYSQYDWQGLYAPTINMASKPAPGQFFYPLCRMSGRLLGQPGSLPPLQAVPGQPTYAIGIYNPFVLQGDPANPLGAFLLSGDSGFPSDGPALSLSDGAALKVSGISFDSSTSFQDNIDVMVDSFLDISNAMFSNAGSPFGSPPARYNINIGVSFNSTLLVTGTLTPNGTNSAAFIQAGQGSTIITNNNTGETGKELINFNGAAFSAAAFIIDGSYFYVEGFTFTGSFTGNGLIAVDNASISNGTGAGPRTCPATLILSHPLVIQDNSVCR